MRFPLLNFIVSLGVCASAMASPDDDAKYEAWLAKFKQADLNDSGGLSKVELDKTKPNQFGVIKRRFDAVDRNNDGQVVPLEYARFVDEARIRFEDAFKKADANNSGGLSKVELGKTSANSFVRLKQNFDGMDANRDGQVTLVELRDYRPPKAVANWRDIFKTADVNDSGSLTKAELDKTAPDVLRDLKKDFAKVDDNRDGSVTYAEYQDYLDDDDDDESPVTDLFKKLLGKN